MPEKRGIWKYLVSSSISWASKSLRTVTTAMKLKGACSLKGTYDESRQHIKKQRHCFINKGPYSQSYDISSSHVWMWELYDKESWVPRNWCLQIVVLEKTLESSLDYMEIKPINSKGTQPWIFIGRTDADAEAPTKVVTWCEEPIHWKRLWCWERLKAIGEGGGRGWDG